MSFDLDKELRKLKYEDYEHNLYVLGNINEYFKNNYLLLNIENKLDFVKHLYADSISEEWFISQCRAASHQIEKLINKESQFYQYYKKILTNQDLIRISQEIIFDISDLSRIIGCTYRWHDININRPNYLSSQQYFLHAKFSYFSKKYIAETTHRHFEFSTMPTLIRQAIEIKIKNMIGLVRVTKRNGDFKFVPMSSIIDFFIENNNFISTPIDIKHLKYINTWTNTYIHSGITPFSWQSLEAIDIIEELFSIKHNETGALHIHGFSYISQGTSLSDLSEALNEKFNATFYLSEKLIEGDKYYS